jgi:hypothetical protein
MVDQVRPAPAPDGRALLCTEPTCRTVLPGDAELCDECGTSALVRIADSGPLLTATAQDRQVAFPLRRAGATTIGRSSDEATAAPEIDVSRLPGSDTVHRQHARITYRAANWHIQHLGDNPLAIARSSGKLVIEPGTSVVLRDKDVLTVGSLSFRVVLEGGG